MLLYHIYLDIYHKSVLLYFICALQYRGWTSQPHAAICPRKSSKLARIWARAEDLKHEIQLAKTSRPPSVGKHNLQYSPQAEASLNKKNFPETLKGLLVKALEIWYVFPLDDYHQMAFPIHSLITKAVVRKPRRLAPTFCLNQGWRVYLFLCKWLALARSTNPYVCSLEPRHNIVHSRCDTLHSLYAGKKTEAQIHLESKSAAVGASEAKQRRLQKLFHCRLYHFAVRHQMSVSQCVSCFKQENMIWEWSDHEPVINPSLRGA